MFSNINASNFIKESLILVFIKSYQFIIDSYSIVIFQLGLTYRLTFKYYIRPLSLIEMFVYDSRNYIIIDYVILLKILSIFLFKKNIKVI